MAHVRKQIRDAVKTALSEITGVTIGQSRVHPLQPADLPIIIVYTTREAIARVSVDKLNRRDIEVLVDCYAMASDTLDDDLDALCASAEAAIADSAGIAALALDLVLVETAIMLSGEGEQQLGLARLRYTVSVETAYGAPETVA